MATFIEVPVAQTAGKVAINERPTVMRVINRDLVSVIKSGQEYSDGDEMKEAIWITLDGREICVRMTMQEFLQTPPV